MPMYSVTLTMRALPGCADELAAFWAESAAVVLAEEPGCKIFHVSRDIADPEQVTIFEVYDSQEAFDIHHNNKARAETAGPKLAKLRQTPIQRVVGEVII